MWGRSGDKNNLVAICENIHSLMCWCFAIPVHGTQTGGSTGTSMTVNSVPVDASAAFTGSFQQRLLLSPGPAEPALSRGALWGTPNIPSIL